MDIYLTADRHLLYFPEVTKADGSFNLPVIHGTSYIHITAQKENLIGYKYALNTNKSDVVVECFEPLRIECEVLNATSGKRIVEGSVWQNYYPETRTTIDENGKVVLSIMATENVQLYFDVPGYILEHGNQKVGTYYFPAFQWKEVLAEHLIAKMVPATNLTVRVESPEGKPVGGVNAEVIYAQHLLWLLPVRRHHQL